MNNGKAIRNRQATAALLGAVAFFSFLPATVSARPRTGGAWHRPAAGTALRGRRLRLTRFHPRSPSWRRGGCCPPLRRR
jgi:hypothetical protein